MEVAGDELDDDGAASPAVTAEPLELEDGARCFCKPSRLFATFGAFRSHCAAKHAGLPLRPVRADGGAVPLAAYATRERLNALTRAKKKSPAPRDPSALREACETIDWEKRGGAWCYPADTPSGYGSDDDVRGSLARHRERLVVPEGGDEFEEDDLVKAVVRDTFGDLVAGDATSFVGNRHIYRAAPLRRLRGGAAESRGWTDVACVTARVVRHAFRRCRELLPAIERADWAAPYDPDAYTRYGTRKWRPDEDEPVDVPDDGASAAAPRRRRRPRDDDDDEDEDEEAEKEDDAAEDDAEMGFEEAPLAVGSRVDVRGGLGVVKFVGEVHYASGEWIGVALDEPKGGNDGTVKGETYFVCNPKHGVMLYDDDDDDDDEDAAVPDDDAEKARPPLHHLAHLADSDYSHFSQNYRARWTHAGDDGCPVVYWTNDALRELHDGLVAGVAARLRSRFSALFDWAADPVKAAPFLHLGFAGPRFTADRAVVLAALDASPAPDDVFALAAEPFRGDRDVVLAAVAQEASDGEALSHASDALKADRGVVLAAVKRCGWALRHAAGALHGDRDVVLAACANCGKALQCASAALKRDREVVVAAVRNDVEALACVELADVDRAVAFAAVEANGLALEHLPREFRSDEALLLAAVRKDGRALEHCFVFGVRDRRDDDESGDESEGPVDGYDDEGRRLFERFAAGVDAVAVVQAACASYPGAAGCLPRFARTQLQRAYAERDVTLRRQLDDARAAEALGRTALVPDAVTSVRSFLLGRDPAPAARARARARGRRRAPGGARRGDRDHRAPRGREPEPARGARRRRRRRRAASSAAPGGGAGVEARARESRLKIERRSRLRRRDA
ncbi:hypothetical protein JL721_4282 [Aureococcus anophagefferens]|nr:hypothetical protein JL721_4282 [Aureococcus anophagefferens]